MFDGNSRGGSFGGLQSVQTLGIINALKTGDPTLDTLVAMLLPLLLGFLLSRARRYSTTVWTFLMRRNFSGNLYMRTISYRTSQANNGMNMNIDDDSHNRYLIKGIKLYVHAKCQLKFDEAELELTEAVGMGGGDSDDEEQGAGNVAMIHNKRMMGGRVTANTSVYSMLRSCQVVKKPIQQQWHDVGMFGGAMVRIWVKDTINDSGAGGDSNGGGGGAKSTRNLEIRLESNGPTSIDDFINAAHTWYMKEMKKLENNNRYLYDLRSFDGRAEQKAPQYSRYRLGEEKTFDSLFSQQTQSLLKIVDDFQQRKGKFGIPGFPYKLGLMLYGPPGTGKTSLIKALAKYTSRHIVNVPLARISTNQELMAIFFNKVYTVAGHNPARLGFKNVIFVLEDVDATSEVVTRRKPPAIDQQMEAAKYNADNTALVKEATELESSLIEFQAKQSPVLAEQDKLSLAGLLNALDGVVDTPGRIVIMTTNYPDLLDPALVRPGRIDKKIKLGYMLAQDVLSMLAHYFQTDLPDSEQNRIKRVLNNASDDSANTMNVTPAQVEQLILEKDSVEDVVQTLEQRADQASGDDSSGAGNTCSTITSETVMLEDDVER
jgi:chaperone BCS1